MAEVRDIDAVITWVDGSDPQLRAKRQAYKSGEDSHTSAFSKTRFDCQGEIYFCIASILKYAPFIRKIFIVTDAQRPEYLGAFAEAGLCGQDRIVVVDHKEIFRDHLDVLPTFNSTTIETMLWNIPGLSEHYVYFNDDFILNRPVVAEDFFVQGRPVLRGAWQPLTSRSFNARKRRLLQFLGLDRTPRKATFDSMQSRAAELLGAKKCYFRYEHVPRPFRKSVLAGYFSAHPDVLRQQITPRFRDAGQFVTPALGYHLEVLHHGTPTAENVPLAYYCHNETHVTEWLRLQQRAPFVCIQNLDEASSQDQATIRQALYDALSDALPQVLQAA